MTHFLFGMIQVGQIIGKNGNYWSNRLELSNRESSGWDEEKERSSAKSSCLSTPRRSSCSSRPIDSPSDETPWWALSFRSIEQFPIWWIPLDGLVLSLLMAAGLPREELRKQTDSQYMYIPPNLYSPHIIILKSLIPALVYNITLISERISEYSNLMYLALYFQVHNQ